MDDIYPPNKGEKYEQIGVIETEKKESCSSYHKESWNSLQRYKETFQIFYGEPCIST